MIKRLKKILFNKGDFSADKFFFIGSTLAATKLVFILLPYFFNSTLYNQFNKVYYTASLLVLFGSIGFNISVSKMNFNTAKVFIAVVINIIITFSLISILSPLYVNAGTFISVGVYSIFGCIGGIYSFKILFEGEYKAYSISMLLYALFHLLIIPAVIYFNFSVTAFFPFITILWFLSCYNLFFKGKTVKSESGFKALYSIGLSAFVINNVVPFALVADKYYVNHFFSTSIANAYTFAWGLTAPIFYIGVLVEKMIYSSSSGKTKTIIKKAMLILAILIVLYISAFLVIVNYMNFLLPASIDKDLLTKIFTLMIFGYAFYVLFHFPVNGYLFKFSTIRKQNKIAGAYFVFTVIFGAVLFWMSRSYSIISYATLLEIIWIYIFILLILKVKILAGKINLSKMVNSTE